MIITNHVHGSLGTNTMHKYHRYDPIQSSLPSTELKTSYPRPPTKKLMLAKAPVSHKLRVCMARDLDVTARGSATLENKLPQSPVKTRRSQRTYTQSSAQFCSICASLCLCLSVSACVCARIYADLGGGGKQQG